jgi:RHS repeat-associated protein
VATYNPGYVNPASYIGQILSNVSPGGDGIEAVSVSFPNITLRFSADSLGFSCGNVVTAYSGSTSLSTVTIDCAIDSIYAVDTFTTCSSSDYRFGFNGQEKDNETKGVGNSYDFGARIYDSRLGRWMSMDPLMAIFPSSSPYVFALNSPIYYYDIEGKNVGNGPAKVVNNSSKPIVIAGDGEWVTNSNGEKSHLKRQAITLNPGDVFEREIREDSKKSFKVYGGKITRANGTIELVDLYDVDFVDVQEGQTLVVDEGFILKTKEEVVNNPDKEENKDQNVPKSEIPGGKSNENGKDDYVKTPQKGEIKVVDGGDKLEFKDDVDEQGQKTGKVKVEYDGTIKTK